MSKKYLDACMNPIRQRIVQFLLRNNQATTAEIGEALSDVPRASLYRHIKVLLDANVISVISEEVKRGAVEKTYAAMPAMMGEQANQDMNDMAQKILMALSGDFHNYFSSPDADPVKDMLTMSQTVVYLSDEEMTDMLQKIGAILNDAMKNEVSGDRKMRKITFLATP